MSLSSQYLSNIDFPVSWSWHRYYCIRSGELDPGPGYLEETERWAQAQRITELEARVSELERLPGTTFQQPRYLKPRFTGGINVG